MTAVTGPPAVARLANVCLRYRDTIALGDVSLDIPAGRIVGLIGPDGVGKSSLLALVAGARAIQQGRVQALGGDMSRRRHRALVCARIAYMPQGLGKNLYPSLSVGENLLFFARLFGHDDDECRRRIDQLTRSTGLYPFLDRPAGKLSGGMKQKLGLCCALVHDPDLLILDEPTTGVDPLARAQFWELINRIRSARPGMTVLVATAYMEEAERFDWLVAMDGGRVLATGTPTELLARAGKDHLEEAFIALLPETRRRGHRGLPPAPPPSADENEMAIEARDLTMRFGDFVAVDHVNFRIRRGEIFGFLGSNGCGKSTTMKMLTGLLPASAGQAWLFGQPLDPRDMRTRRRVGYMSQSFSLYDELTVRQNLLLHARLFDVPAAQVDSRVAAMIERFGLSGQQDALPPALPLGLRQRLSLAVAVVHQPELLILDEPTSGVDPIARDEFWQWMMELARRDKVTIFISTHFMNEAERCDRISLMHAGRVLDSDTPANLIAKRQTVTLNDAFISYLQEATAGDGTTQPLPDAVLRSAADPSVVEDGAGVVDTMDTTDQMESKNVAAGLGAAGTSTPRPHWWVRLRDSRRRIVTHLWRESLELQRDPVRSALALLGSLLLMFVMGYGINMDVEDMSFAVLDRDQSVLSRDYALNLSGSRYFSAQPPLQDDEDMDNRMRSGRLALALEIPEGFARELERGGKVQIGAWIDGAMPARAETVAGFVQGMHGHWLTQQAQMRTGSAVAAAATVETRFRYNPDVKSLLAIVPAVIPLLLLMMPAMLTALAIAREKELGSIINFYVTPTTRIEFLLGKQLPYVALAMVNFFLMTLAAVALLGVPLNGSLPALTLAALLFSLSSTAIGMLIATLVRSQIAAIFFAMVATMIPAVQFAGLINPVSAMEGAGRWIGEIYPASHMVTISRGVFSKSLYFDDLASSFWPLVLAAPVIFLCAAALLKKQGS